MKETHIYQKSLDAIYQETKSTSEGLSQIEAEFRLNQFGENKLIEEKVRPFILRFFDQFKDFMVIVLMVAAGIAFLAAILEGKPEDLTEGFLIIGIVMINALLGVIQEARAEEALASIKKLSAPHAKVLRDGKETILAVELLVPGDIVLLQAGDFIPADLRLIEVINLKIDESALTGESVPVEKISEPLKAADVALGDQMNLAFMSTVVTYGRGQGIVVKTGMQTEIGKIAQILSETENTLTPLQKSIASLGKMLAFIALGIVSFIFLLQVLRGFGTGEFHLIEAFMSSIALAVAAIPEGLPAIITIVLSIGMQNLVKKKAIMRKLPAVETLGSTSIICSDKTGTLTQNIMTVTDIYTYQQQQKVSQINLNPLVEKLILYGALCNDTVLTHNNDDQLITIGDPTEIALTDLALHTFTDLPLLIKNHPRKDELPFDSVRKMMTTVHQFNDQFISITKGAPDIIFEKAQYYAFQGQIFKLTDTIKRAFIDANLNFTNDALRVLAVGYKKVATNDLTHLSQAQLEDDLILLGLIGMIDPARPEVKPAINETKQAGITTIMITGDHKNTAVAIAKELGILEENHLAITGQELDLMDHDTFLNKIETIRVYARVSPENKVRIVDAWKSLGKVVAMTGDGVNDAPSIKKADIGIAMGITGTEVAKGASDMILTDDNFATIVGAVSEGRTIFANIKKAIHFLLSCNIGEIITIFLGVTLGIFLFPNEPNLAILSASQILWVNLVTDSFMAIGLGLEPKEPDIMNKPPREVKKSIFADGLGIKIAWQGTLIGVITFIAFYIGYQLGGLKHAQTLTFMVLAFSQLVHAFNVRSDHFSVFKLNLNKYLIYAFVICLILQLLTVFVPFISENIFGIDSILHWYWYDWLIVLGLSLTPLVVVEIQKMLQKNHQ